MLTIVSIITVFASWGLVRLAFYATDSNRNIEELKAAIIRDDFIPESLTIDDIVSDDQMLIAWDVNARTPRYFSKWTASNLNDDDNNHDMKVW